MIDHVGFSVSDYARAKAFYEKALAPLGYTLVMEVTAEQAGQPAAGFGSGGKPDFWIGAEGTPLPTLPRERGRVGRGLHIAILAKDRQTVDAFHRAALAAGGKDNGAPGVRPHYHANYYGLLCSIPMGTTSRLSVMLQSKGKNMCKELVRLVGPALFSALLAAMPAEAGTFRLLRTQEATIADILAAFKAKELTCRQLVQMYLDRIEAYDRKGPALNAIVMVNPNALATADALDAKFAQSGLSGPLHCVPLIVKDNYDTVDMPTSAGSLSLKGSTPLHDAFQVRKLREAGALIVAKSNMAEFAWSPFETVSSLVPGYTRNPYALDRVPAGSSGGTAAAVAASFGAVGLGTDTGNSIRGPSSHTSLVGIRSTMGLTSRDGIIPLFLNRDIGGPMARTVADAVAVFDVIAGHDPADPVTAAALGRRPDSYLAFLDRNGLTGARVGAVRQLFMGPESDPEILQLLERALADMKEQGAEIVEGINIPELAEIPPGRLFCNRFKHDINGYLARLGPQAPVRTFDEILASQKFHPSIEKRMLDAAAEPPPDQNPRCQEADENGRRLGQGVLKAMDDARLDALVYPSWNNPPRLIGDLNTPHGNNSPRISPPTGFPAITIPMGFVRGTLPAGLQILGRPWSEPTLIKIGYAYEQATRHRRPPASAPPLAAAP